MIRKPDLKRIVSNLLDWKDEGKRKLVDLDEVVAIAEKAFEHGIQSSADYIWEFEYAPSEQRASISNVRDSLYNYIGCHVNAGSSRMCQKGTRSCTVDHSAPKKIDCGICHDRGTLGSGSVDNPVEWCYKCGGGKVRERASKEQRSLEPDGSGDDMTSLHLQTEALRSPTATFTAYEGIDPPDVVQIYANASDVSPHPIFICAARKKDDSE